MSKPLLTRRQIIERLNVTAAWFYRKRRDLEAKGFPKSLPGFAQGRWSPDAVDAWIALHSDTPQAPEPDPQPVEDPQEALRQALQDRAQEIAGSGKRTADAPDVR